MFEVLIRKINPRPRSRAAGTEPSAVGTNSICIKEVFAAREL
jgi:hypothetical protein